MARLSVDRSPRERVMAQSESKVIGVFAYRSRTEVICTDVDACVIAGSEEAMRHHYETMHSRRSDELTIRKTRFGEIIQGMMAGGAYGFDRDARFYPLAKELGLPVEPAAFTSENKFFVVRLRVSTAQ